MTCAQAGTAVTRTILMAVMVSGCTSFLQADDLNPPSWTRSGAANRSTSAEWDFDDDGTNPLLPDGNTVPLITGDFKATLDGAFPATAPHPSGFASAGLTYTGGSGFINNGTGPATLAFNVPNWIDQEPVKFLRLQVTYTGPTPGTRLFGAIGTSGGPDVVEIPGPIVPGTAGQSLYFYQDWTCLPNPDWEQVVLDVLPGTFIDQVVIDTISTVPEPTAPTLGLVALAVMGTVKRRRAD